MNNKYVSAKDRIATAVEQKEAGNDYFKNGNLRKAIKRYHIALMHLKDLEKPSPLDKLAGVMPEQLSEDTINEIYSLRSSCYNNLAACLLKGNEYEKVVNYTTKVLEIDEKNTKALFRRGQAYFHLKNIEKAESDFQAIKTIDPKETCCDSYGPKMKLAKEQQQTKEKEMYRKMMSGGS